MSDSGVNLTKEFDILDVVSSYIEVKNGKAICPFHPDDDPSMSINRDLGIFKCFGAGCGVGGNSVKFVSLMEDISYSKAIEKLAKKYNKPRLIRNIDSSSELYIPIKTLHKRVADIYHKILLKDPRAKDARLYLKKRGISKETVQKLNIGYAPFGQDFLYRFDFDPQLLKEAGLLRDNGKSFFVNRIMFPLTQGEYVVGFMGRTLSTDPKTPKYLNSKESDWFHKKDIIYGWDINKSPIRKAGKLIVVEGQFDIAQLIERQINIGLAVSGSYFNQQQAYQLSKHVKDVLIFCDGDKAGFSFGLNVGQMFLSHGNRVTLAFSKGKDPDDLLLDKGSFKKAIQGITYSYLDFLYKLGKGTPEDKLKEAIKRLSTVEDDIVKLTHVKQLSKLAGIPEEELYPLVNRYQANPYTFNTKPKKAIEPSVEKCLLAIAYVIHKPMLKEDQLEALKPYMRDFLLNPKSIGEQGDFIDDFEFTHLILLYDKYSKKDKERIYFELYNQYKINLYTAFKESLKKELRQNPDPRVLKMLTDIDDKIEALENARPE